MRHAFRLHPNSQRPGEIAIEATALRSECGMLLLDYTITGMLAALDLPPAAEQGRADDLWRHSCLEAFVRIAHDPGYHEFNFAPSGRWAAYDFTGYRAGMTVADDGPRYMTSRRGADSFALSATLDLSRSPQDAAWRIGLSAVIEDTDGGLSYWALAHPPGAPDFHHPDGFVLELPEPS